jgi:hypothetical protein
MTRTGPGRATRVLLLTLFVFGITATVLILPSYFSSEAVARKTGTGLLTRTESGTPELPNYDIRSDKNAADRVAGFRSSLSRSASDVADVRDGFARGEERLRALVPTLKSSAARTAGRSTTRGSGSSARPSDSGRFGSLPHR